MLQQTKKSRLGLKLIVCSVAAAGIGTSTFAATLCVDAGKAGCYATIGAAVSAAATGDTIEVAQGTYKEDVIIGKALSLVGKNSANSMTKTLFLEMNPAVMGSHDTAGPTSVWTGSSIEGCSRA